MTPWKLERIAQECGRWMYSADQNFSKSHPAPERLWFAQPVLTPKNPDPSSPKIPIDDAREVFATLEKRHLITRHALPITDAKGTRGEVDVFIINREMVNRWEKFISKGGFWNMQASPIVYYFVGQRWAWLILIFLLGAFATKYCQDLGDDVYKCSLGKVFQKPDETIHTTKDGK